MKISGARVAGFLRALPPEVAAVLLYGPDRGLVCERGEAVVRSVADTVSDPFRVVELTTAAVRGDPARLLNYPAAVFFIVAGLGLVLVVLVRAHRDRRKQQTAALGGSPE